MFAVLPWVSFHGSVFAVALVIHTMSIIAPECMICPVFRRHTAVLNLQ